MKLAKRLVPARGAPDPHSPAGDPTVQQCPGPGGGSPPPRPQDLLQELEEDYARLEALIACINRTNCCTLVDGVPLSDLLARRDLPEGQAGHPAELPGQRSELVSRRTVGEIRIRSTVDVRSMQREVDRMSKELRELDEKIQEANWTTELLEG